MGSTIYIISMILRGEGGIGNKSKKKKISGIFDLESQLSEERVEAMFILLGPFPRKKN
jgi:hypothetical protein